MMKRTFFLIKFTLVFLAAAFIFLAPVRAQTTVLETQTTTTLYLPLVTKNYSGEDGFGNVSGIVMNAREDTPMAGVEVCWDDGSLPCAITNSQGEYAIENIPSGERTFLATGPAEFKVETKKIYILANYSAKLDFDLYEKLDENQFRVVLTWDGNPSWPCAPYVCPNDFNLHMWWTKDNITYERFDVDHRGNCQDLEVFPNVCYENDEQFGSGPDAIAFKYRNVSSKGIYYIAVLNYYADWPNVPAFFERSPRARVQVFDSSQELPVFDLAIDPGITQGEGDLWYVWQLNFGTPITQNCLLQFDQVGDLPPDDCFPEFNRIMQ